MVARRKDLRTRIFDLTILVFSWISIIAGIIAIIITGLVFKIVNFRPYFLYTIISIIGLIGFRIWVKENID